jgi:hypothetical protein
VAGVGEFFQEAEAEASRHAHAAKTRGGLHSGLRKSKTSPGPASRHAPVLTHSSTGLSGGAREGLSSYSSLTDLAPQRATGSDSYLQQALEALCINMCVKLAPNVGHAYDSIRMSSAELFVKLATVFNAGVCVCVCVLAHSHEHVCMFMCTYTYIWCVSCICMYMLLCVRHHHVYLHAYICIYIYTSHTCRPESDWQPSAL